VGERFDHSSLPLFLLSFAPIPLSSVSLFSSRSVPCLFLCLFCIEFCVDIVCMHVGCLSVCIPMHIAASLSLSSVVASSLSSGFPGNKEEQQHQLIPVSCARVYEQRQHTAAAVRERGRERTRRKRTYGRDDGKRGAAPSLIIGSPNPRSFTHSLTHDPQQQLRWKSGIRIRRDVSSSPSPRSRSFQKERNA